MVTNNNPPLRIWCRIWCKNIVNIAFKGQNTVFLGKKKFQIQETKPNPEPHIWFCFSNVTKITKQNTNPLPKIRHQNLQKNKNFTNRLPKTQNQTKPITRICSYLSGNLLNRWTLQSLQTEAPCWKWGSHTL